MAELPNAERSSGTIHRDRERGRTASNRKVASMHPFQPSSRASLTTKQQDQAQDALEAISKAVTDWFDQLDPAGEKPSEEAFQTWFAELVAEHLTDDPQVDDEILQTTQDMAQVLRVDPSRNRVRPEDPSP